MAELPWYREFFGEEYFRLFDGALTPERAAREVEGIVDLLSLPPGSQILDLCCGHGRIAIPLALAGYRMTGLDLSELFLERAQADAAAAGVSIDWLHGDMRSLPFEAAFEEGKPIFQAVDAGGSARQGLDTPCEIVQSLGKGRQPCIGLVHRALEYGNDRGRTIERGDETCNAFSLVLHAGKQVDGSAAVGIHRDVPSRPFPEYRHLFSSEIRVDQMSQQYRYRAWGCGKFRPNQN